MQNGIDYIGLSVTYFCHDGKGNFVMAKRSQRCRDEHGKWDTGGGAVEFGISVEETLAQEIKEEYCCNIIKTEFLGYRDVHRIQAGKATHWLALDFKVQVDPQQVKIGEPHKFLELKWFTFNTLPDDKELHSQLPGYFAKYKRSL